MKIIQFSTQDKRHRRQFLKLPFRLYKDIHQWVPPLSIDENTPFDTRNPFYQHSKAGFFIAYGEKFEPIGRLVVIANSNYINLNKEKTAFFCMFECINSIAASKRLFESGFKWAREHGLTKIIGPKGFTALDGSGLLVKGFEHRPAFGMPYNPDYYPTLIEASKFITISENVSGYLPTDMLLPEKIHRISELVKKKKGLRIAQFSNRKDLKSLVPVLKDHYNDSLGGTTGNVPITHEEAQGMAIQMLRFANPKLIKIVMKKEKPIGFLFAYPDISEAIQKTRGRVFPFGWITLLRAYNKTEWINVNGAGILEQHRGIGGTAILFSEMQKSIQMENFKHADLVQIGVENEKMQRELSSFGIEFYKTHRLYEREI
jgi:hypothetical protein